MTTMRELLTGSLRLINAVSANEVPTPDDMNISLQSFNGMLDSWSAERLGIYTINPYYFVLTPQKQDYTLGAGGDWDVPRPMNIQQAYVAYNATVTPGVSPTIPTDVLYQYNFDTNTTANYIDSRMTGATIPTDDISFQTTDEAEFGAGSFQLSAPSPYDNVVPYPLPAMSLDGGATVAITSQKITFEFSTNRLTAAPGYNGRLFTMNAGTDYEFWMEMLTDSPGFYECTFNTQSYSNITGAVNIPINTWTQWAVEFDFTTGDPDTPFGWGTMYVFMNGALVGGTTHGPLFNEEGIWPFVFTKDATSFDFKFGPMDVTGYSTSHGFIDEVRLTKDVLYTSDYTPATAAFPLPATPLPPGPPVVTENQSTVDLPIEMLNDAQWAGISVKKTISTFPTKMYDNGDFPLRKLSFWPVPQQVNGVVLWLWQPLINKDNLDEELNLPKGYERALRYNLAIEIAPEFGKQLPPSIERTAAMSKAVIKRLNSGQQVMVGDVALAETGTGIFNWLVGTTIPN